MNKISNLKVSNVMMVLYGLKQALERPSVYGFYVQIQTTVLFLKTKECRGDSVKFDV